MKRQLRLEAGSSPLVSFAAVEMLQIHIYHNQVIFCFLLLGVPQKCQTLLFLSLLHGHLLGPASLAYHIQKQSLALASYHICLVAERQNYSRSYAYTSEVELDDKNLFSSTVAIIPPRL